MDKKQILHRLLVGFCGYMSCGAPEPFWNLAKDLILEVYGPQGVTLFEHGCHKFDLSTQYDEEKWLYTFFFWEDGGNTRIGPEELIERLEQGNFEIQIEAPE